LILKAIFALLSRLYNTVNGFKNQLNSHWKDLEIKFRPASPLSKLFLHSISCVEASPVTEVTEEK
jgi:hypothetical protein